MDCFHSFRIGNDEIIVTSIVLLAAEMLGAQVLDLQAGTHGTIEDEDLLFDGIEVFSVCVFSLGHEVLLILLLKIA